MKAGLYHKIFIVLIPFVVSCCHKVGGPDSPVMCEYAFFSHQDFIDFYNVFKQYNEQRYLVPCEIDKADADYIFSFGIVTLRQCNSKEYQTVFSNQTLSINFQCMETNFMLEGKSMSLSNSHDLNNLTIEYRLVHDYVEVDCHSDTNELVFSGIIKTIPDSDELVSFLNIFKESMERGRNYLN